MSLRVVLHKLQIVFLAQSANLVGIGASAIEMNYQDSLRALGYCSLNPVVVNLQCLTPWLHEHRHQSVLRDSMYRRYESIGRHNDLISRLHHAELYICTENPNQRVESIAHSDTVFRTDIVGIVPLKLVVFLTAEIPPRVHYAVHRLVQLVGIFLCYSLKIVEEYHCKVLYSFDPQESFIGPIFLYLM